MLSFVLKNPQYKNLRILAAAVLLPLWVLIERRARAPMLDLSLFADRL